MNSHYLSFGEQLAADAEQTIELVDPSIVNAGLTWIPNLGVVLVLLALIATIAVLWLSPSATFRTKVTRTITSVLWSALSVTLLAILSSFAASSSISGASPLFVISSISAAFLGISALVSRTRNMLSPEDIKPLSPDASEQIPNASAFWGPVVKTVVHVTLDDDDGKVASSVRSSSSAPASHLPHPSRTLRELRDSGNWKTLAFRAFSEAAGWLVPLLAIAGVTVLSFIFLELPSNPGFASIPEVYMACEMSIIACAVAGSWLIFQRRPVGFIVPLAISALYGIAEHFVESFKASAIMPSDLRSAGTGMSVASGYEYELTSEILIVITLFCLAAAAIAWLRDPLSRFLSRKEYMVGDRWKGKFLSRIAARKQRRGDVICVIKNAVVAILSVVLGFQLALAPIAPAMEVDWEEEGIVFDYWQTHASIDGYGIIPSLLAALQLEDIEPPDGYDHVQAAQLQSSMASLYDAAIASSQGYREASAQFDAIRPNVLLVMDESFVDLSYLGGLGVGYEGLPYTRNLDAIAKGKASVSVYGGGTCDSEFEALTGTSLGYIGGGITPYALYDLSRIDSIPKQFKALGYETCGIHPERATNWGRDKIYPELGFDEFLDADSFEDATRLRGHVRDFETYDMAIGRIAESDEPQFIFDLTMSNHGGYESGLIPEEDSVHYDFEDTAILDPFGGSIANEYLSSVRMSDRDAQHLIYRLSEIDEPTVVAFFGDHHPGFSWWFQEWFADRTDDISFQESMYQTDWFVWANYPVFGSAWAPQTPAAANAGSPVVHIAEPDGIMDEDPTQALDLPIAPDVLDALDATLQDEGAPADGEGAGEGLAGEDGTLGSEPDRLEAIDWESVLGPIDVYLREVLSMNGMLPAEPSPPTAAQLAEPEDDWYPDLGSGSVLYTGTMSPANLMGWTMTFIGTPLTDYEKASYASRWWVQSNNIYGYMDASGRWHPMELANFAAGPAVFDEGMQIISNAQEQGLPGIEELIADSENIDMSVADAIGAIAGAYGEQEEMDAISADSLQGFQEPQGLSAVPSQRPSRQYRDAVMVNVMRWISYMNFAELLR